MTSTHLPDDDRIPIGTRVRTEEGEGYVAQIQGDAVVVRGLPQPAVYSREQILRLLNGEATDESL